MPYWFGVPIPWFRCGRTRSGPADGIRSYRAAATGFMLDRNPVYLAGPITMAAYVMLRRRSPSHVQAPRPSRAASRYFINVGPAKGLARKPIAPALSARARTLSSGKAVMKMNGARRPWARICVSRSKPLITDICTSAITQDVSFSWADCKNSSADANVWTAYPCDLRRLLVAARTDASSSMTEITESVDKKTVLPDTRNRVLTAAQNPRLKVGGKSGL
jgi:hypothetical protein